jgi:hypothetical protein
MKKCQRVVTHTCTYGYSGRKRTESLGNVTVRGEKGGKSKGGARWPTVSLSMYSITEHIYYSQLSSVAILLQPEPVSHRIIQGNDFIFSPFVLSSFGLSLPPTYLVLTVTEARRYFASTVHVTRPYFQIPKRKRKRKSCPWCEPMVKKFSTHTRKYRFSTLN